jgi:hypothetical protein
MIVVLKQFYLVWKKMDDDQLRGLAMMIMPCEDTMETTEKWYQMIVWHCGRHQHFNKFYTLWRKRNKLRCATTQIN